MDEKLSDAVLSMMCEGFLPAREGDHRIMARELLEARQHIAKYREALRFYAVPETYIAIGIFPDPPCGEFINDYGEAYRAADGNTVVVPGEKARAALALVETEETK